MPELRDSARDRKRLDKHAERCIWWLCPHERARRGGNPRNKKKANHCVPRFSRREYFGGFRYYNYLPFFAAPTRDSPAMMVDGCRRRSSSQPLYRDDTSRDYGSTGVWLSGIIR